MKNYWKMRSFSPFSAFYAYADHNSNLAELLFAQNRVHVKFKGKMVREGSPYCIVFCKVLKRDAMKFEEALEKLKDKMLLLGYVDYSKICDEITNMIDRGMKGRRKESETICDN